MAVILIVEDEPFTRELAEICIDSWGHTAISAETVGAALAALHSRSPIDALFTDIRLKDDLLGGCELGRAAVARHQNLRVLYTTGNRLTPELKSKFISGAHFLSKPYTPDQLQTGLEALLEA